MNNKKNINLTESGNLGDLLFHFIKDRNLSTTLLATDVENNHRTALANYFIPIKAEFVAQLNKNHIVFNIPESEISGYPIPRDQFFQIDDITFDFSSVNTTGFERISSQPLLQELPGSENFPLRNNGNIEPRYSFPNNVIKDRVRFGIFASLSDKLDYGSLRTNDSFNDSVRALQDYRIRSFELRGYSVLQKGFVTLESVEKKHKSLLEEIKAKEEETNLLKVELENVSWISTYMKEHSITYENFNIIKSKMILNQLKEDSDDVEKLTQISELVDMDQF